MYCYEEARVMKAFTQLLKVSSVHRIDVQIRWDTNSAICLQVLYNKDCISAQAIIYWHQKGAKPQGKNNFLKMTEALVKFLEEQEEESDDDDE